MGDDAMQDVALPIGGNLEFRLYATDTSACGQLEQNWNRWSFGRWLTEPQLHF